jgi:NADPH:quinone reductase-like Zn-dependent oxidoreductase
MKAVVFERFGDPAEVLQVREVPEPKPGPGQVLVRMLASPIGPADFLTVRGEYGHLPKLPATPGYEGVGIVEAGRGLLGWMRAGSRVAVINETSGNWQEKVVVSSLRVVPVAKHVSDDQAATFFINPATALILTRHVLKVPPRAWLLQTAAGSALGRMIIRLGRHYGFRTINVVRRREEAEELLRAGGDAAIASESESVEDRVRALTDGEGVFFALDAVGGKTGSAVAQSLGRGGRLVIFGTLAEEPLILPSRMLFLGVKRIEGFWFSDWANRQNFLTMMGLFRRIHKLMAKGVLSTDIGPVFPLDDIKGAIGQASTPSRRGKILLRINSAT